MKNAQTLIAIAREKVHTDRELAARLGEAEQTLNALKKGRRPMSPEMAIALCEVAGISGREAMEWVAVAIEQNPKNAEKKTLIQRVLFGESFMPGEGSRQLTTYTS